MVGWRCSLISNLQQNVGLIRQFALLVFSVGGKEGSWWESPPTGRGPPAAGEGVGLRGEVLVLQLSVGLTGGGDRRGRPLEASPGPDSWIWEEGWEMGSAPLTGCG